jgi:hypothetical protein
VLVVKFNLANLSHLLTSLQFSEAFSICHMFEQIKFLLPLRTVKIV